MKKRIFALIITMLIVLTIVTPSGNIAAASAQISDFGRQAAEDFLSEHLSLFSVGHYQDGVFVDWWTGEVLDEAPLVYLANTVEKSGLFDRHGNLLSEDSPSFLFRVEGPAVASRFYLYDLNNDGIPEIVIWGGVYETCNVVALLYTFVGGEYRNAGFGNRFYIDEHGRIVMVESTTSFSRFSHITFTQESIEVEMYKETCCCDTNDLSTLNNLTRIEPLTDLHAEITASVNRRLGLVPVLGLPRRKQAILSRISLSRCFLAQVRRSLLRKEKREEQEHEKTNICDNLRCVDCAYFAYKLWRYY